MQKYMFLSIFVILFLYCIKGFSNTTMSLDLQEVNLTDAIYEIAKYLNKNIVISPAIDGVTTLHIHDAKPEQILDLLLASQNLSKWQMGNTVFIAPREELIKQQEDELKWQKQTMQMLPLVTKIWQVKYAKANEIAQLLQSTHIGILSERGRVHVDERTNSICIRDIAAKVSEVECLLEKLDVPVKQVLIEARLVSIDSDFERELGLQFSVKSSQLEDKNPLLQQPYHYSLAVVKLADGSLFDVKLAALENQGHAELISTPHLFTENRQPASIEAGEEVPYQEVSESGGTAIVFKKAVLALKVTPYILPGNKVLLKLQINQDRPTNKLVLGVPTISTRQITTSVLLLARQTIVLGGIYETNNETGQKELPLISQIPLLGWLFKQQSIRKSKRELLIFVTPRILQNYEKWAR